MEGVELSYERQKYKAHPEYRAYCDDGERKHYHTQTLQGRRRRVCGACEKHQHEDGDEILNQQQADHDLADVAMMQHRRWQQFDADDGARKCDRDTRYDCLADREIECEHQTEPDAEEHGHGDQGGQQTFAGHVFHFRRWQIESNEKEQEDNADLGNFREKVGVGYERQTVGTQQTANGDVGDE